jgi:hypothetical protein
MLALNRNPAWPWPLFLAIISKTRRNMLKTLTILTVSGAALALAACGHNTEQRAATGAVTGAVVGGPVGAAAGAAVGTAVSKTVDD